MKMISKKSKFTRGNKNISYNKKHVSVTIEIQNAAKKKGQQVLICDDLLATGRTAKAAAKLVEKIGGKVTGFAFIIELMDLKGSKEIKNYKHESLVKY